MSTLPPHHVRRPRLTDLCGFASVVVVEAAGGYGKSVFAAELTDAWQAVGIEVVLEQGPLPMPLLAARLRAAVHRAGFHVAAAAMAAEGEDAVGAVDAGLAALAGEPCAVVIDDAHNAAPDAAGLIVRIAGAVSGDQRLLVLGRHLPPGAERLRRGEYLHLDADDLGLRPEESLDLCVEGFGLDVGLPEASRLVALTGGWTAAAVLAAARSRRTGEDVGALAAAAGGGEGRSGVLASILDEAVVALGSESKLLAQVARLPLLDAEVVDAATGVDGYFARALAAGLPFTPAGPPWWGLPGPVRDWLAGLAPPDRHILRRAASDYAARGELAPALRMLLAEGDDAGAGTLLAGAQPSSVAAIDVVELRSVLDRLPPEAVDGHPAVLLHVARSCESAGLVETRSRLLSRAEKLRTDDSDPPLRRAIDAELATDLARDGANARAEVEARRILAEAGPREKLTRARALSTLGRVMSQHVDKHGARDEAAMREAAELLAQARQLFGEVGMDSLAAAALLCDAMWVRFARGEAAAALERLDEALSLSFDRPRQWGFLLSFRAEILGELGRYQELRAVADEIFELASRFSDKRMRAYGEWNLAIAASQQGDADETLQRFRAAEAHKGEWWAVASGEFLASAADCLDRVGHTALASEYFERVLTDPQDAEALIAMAHGALLARHGDPDEAEERLVAALGHRIDPREYWRVTLLRAYAAFRRGERSAGALAARAFEEAARLGQPQLPLLRERSVTEELLWLATETGQPAALALEASSLPVGLAVLGRFELTRAGRVVGMAPGKPAQLLKLVAVSGGRVPTEKAIETLWPDAELEAGRNRLRTELNRLRDAAGDVLTRRGDVLVLDPDVRLDLELFERHARRALALGSTEPTLALSLARTAVALYRGEVLPDDPYEEWVMPARESAHRTMLDLLDLCAGAAATSGDLDEMRRVVERTIELAPYDDDRYLRVASVLLQQGRRGAALTVVRRARRALAELGLQPPAPLVNLERSIVA